jgi:hypothetical protein
VKRREIFLVTLILVFISLTFYFYRQIFFYRYEPEYYEELYYHSQWNYPSSTRGISDGELYKFVGYRLTQGENPFNINFEAPPFAKYLYGLAEKYFGNPYWVSIILYLGSFLILFLIAKSLVEKRFLVLLCLLLYATSQYVATQVRETMLDLPLAVLLLANVLFFIRYLNQPKFSSLIFAGIFLGLATGTKIGVYTPFSLLLGLILIFLTVKRFFPLLLYMGATFAGYVLAFFCYFIRHPNPIPWLRLHQKPFSFYFSPGIHHPDLLAQWKVIFLNTWEGFGLKISLSWDVLLPVGVIVTLLVLVMALRKRHWALIYICGLNLIVLAVNTVMPFYPRYLIPLAPLFILLITFYFRKAVVVILLLICLNLPPFFDNLIPKGPTGDAQASAHFMITRAYHELYRSITPADRKKISEKDFIRVWEYFFNQLAIRETKIDLEEISRSKGKWEIKYKIRYLSQYGELTTEPVVNFVRSNNQWKIAWQWGYLWPGYSPETKIIVNEKTIPLLRIENNQGQILARRGQWSTVYIMPRVMFDWSKFLNRLAVVAGESSVELDKRIKRVVPDHYPRFVGYLDPALKDGAQKAQAIPGVTLRTISYPVIVTQKSAAEEIARLIKTLQKERPELFYTQAEIYFQNGEEKIPLPFKSSGQKDVVVRI